jgi:hypothetical protein
MNRSIITALLFSTGCIQIGGTLEDVCIHKSGIMMEGMPSELPSPGELPAVEHAFVHEDLDVLAPLLDSGLDAEVFFTAATLRADHDLDFVRRVDLVGSSANPDATLPAIDLASCAGDCNDGHEVSLVGAEDRSMMEYLTTGALEFRMTVSGELPTEDWALDVDVCLRGDVSHRASL